MIVTRRFPLRLTLLIGARMMLIGGAWAAFIFALFAFADLHFLRVPFLPIATIGTAVAFYVGFKNNAAYDRFWEGRKIWGGIVNASRAWGTSVLAFIQPGDESPGAQAVRRDLIYRQLAWINAVRLQLRKKSRFFDKPARATKKRLENHKEAMRNDWDLELKPFLDAAELEEVSRFKNPATHLMRTQGERLAGLYTRKNLDLFHQIELMHLVTEMYTLQGKAERIKNTPFPRQYAEYSRVFTRAFIFFVPFGLLDVFGVGAPDATLLDEVVRALPMVLSGGLIAWVFGIMEGIGDASEDPFERSMNDVPMNALCRTIEIDLREMLGEDDLPEPEQPIAGLMY